MKVKRKIIKIDEELCDGCGQCVPGCAEGALQIVNGKARLVADKYCDGLGACIGDCPTGALQMEEREAEDFDPEAVERYLEQQARTETKAPAGGCPSAQLKVFAPAQPAESGSAGESALSHWPVQIRLVPANAPFLKNSDLLVLADCVAVTYAALHSDLIPGKVVLMGCPKFDDAEEYVQKFAEIFSVADINSVTVAMMEVPCCSALPNIVRKGMKAANRAVPLEELLINTRGKPIAL